MRRVDKVRTACREWVFFWCVAAIAIVAGQRWDAALAAQRQADEWVDVKPETVTLEFRKAQPISDQAWKPVTIPTPKPPPPPGYHDVGAGSGKPWEKYAAPAGDIQWDYAPPQTASQIPPEPYTFNWGEAVGIGIACGSFVGFGLWLMYRFIRFLIVPIQREGAAN